MQSGTSTWRSFARTQRRTTATRKCQTYTRPTRRWGDGCSLKNTGVLSPERIAALTALGFDWAPSDKVWHARFQELLAYAAAHGTTLISRTDEDNKTLGTWVRRQRELHAKCELPAEREALLNDIGFEWQKLENAWDEHYEALVAFKEANGGSVAVPKTIKREYNPLGKWLSDQRRRMREGTLEPDRVAKLQALGVTPDRLRP
jgi:hypothetical protein